MAWDASVFSFSNLSKQASALCMPSSFRALLSSTPSNSILISGLQELSKYKYKILVSVGDYVTSLLLKHLSARPNLIIIDCKVMRASNSSICSDIESLLSDYRLIKVRNPRSRITREALDTIQGSLYNHNKTAIIVDGEEDLLALPSILFAPIGSVVTYGYPRIATLLVKVTPRLKQEVRVILGKFEECQ